MLPIERSAKVEIKTLSVPQLEKGCKKGQKAESNEEMSKELLKKLPPRRKVECKPRKAYEGADASRRKASLHQRANKSPACPSEEIVGGRAPGTSIRTRKIKEYGDDVMRASRA